MYKTVKTIFHSHIELMEAIRQPYAPLPHSTLNEKYQIGHDEPLLEGMYPEMRYIAIGRGAHLARLDSQGRVKASVASHDVNHACLYEHIPFIMRPVAEDLQGPERAKYGMRCLEEHNGQAYFVYYLRAIDLTTSYPKVETISVVNNQTVNAEYNPTSAQLNPVIQDVPSNTTNNPSSGQHLGVSSDLTFVLEKSDIDEIMNCIMIIFGDEEYATISEIGVVAAIPQVVNSTLGGVNVSYTEAIAASVTTHIPANISLALTTDRITENYSLGNVLPRTR